MKKITFLFVMMFVLVSNVKAQFASSETVYCYKYDHTSNDGIKSKKSNQSYYWVNFQNGMMGFKTDNYMKNIRQHLLENPSYYEDAARNNLANNYSRWESSPAGLPTLGPARATVYIYKYNPQYSTSSKETYRRLSKSACSTGSIWDTYGSGNYWSDESWGTTCYSFSTDHSEMIIWSTDNPEKRDYYRRIDESELKPNTDFLY